MGWVREGHFARLSSDHEQQIAHILGKEISEVDGDNATACQEKEISQLANSILEDNRSEMGDMDYLLQYLGFADSWPLALSDELRELGITSSKDEDDEGYRCWVDGVVHPPVKSSSDGN